MTITIRNFTVAGLFAVASMFSTATAYASCAAPGGADYCGGQGAGGCYCDAACAGFGDCCSDYIPICLPVEPPNTGGVCDLECDTQSKKKTLPAYGALDYEVQCPSGYLATGGSAWVENGTAQSQTRAQGKAWLCGFYNSGSFPVEVTCSVKCCRTK